MTDTDNRANNFACTIFRELIHIGVYLYKLDNNVKLKYDLSELYELYEFNTEQCVQYLFKNWNFFIDDYTSSLINTPKLPGVIKNFIERRKIHLQSIKSNSLEALVDNMRSKTREEKEKILCGEISIYSVAFGYFYEFDIQTFCIDIQNNTFQFLLRLYKLSKLYPNNYQIAKISSMLYILFYKQFDYCMEYYFIGASQGSCIEETVGYYTFKIMYLLYATSKNYGIDLVQMAENTPEYQHDFFLQIANTNSPNPYINYVETSWNMYNNTSYNELYQSKVENGILHFDETDLLSDTDTDYSVFMNKKEININGYIFTIGILYNKYITNNIQKEVFLYKGDGSITYEEFINWENPTWYSNYYTALRYKIRAKEKNWPPKEVYAFSLYRNLNLFIITKQNLLNLLNLYGNTLVWAIGYDDVEWQLLMIDCVKYKILNKNNINDAKNTLTYANIIDFIFFYTPSIYSSKSRTIPQSSKDKLYRFSVYHFDLAFTKGLCLILNTKINIIGNTGSIPNDNLRIDGYYAEPLIKRGGGLFHPEFAVCNPYNVIERRGDNPYDFSYSVHKFNRGKWCSQSECVDIGLYKSFDMYYLYYWGIIEEWAKSETLKVINNKDIVQYQIDLWKSFSVNIQVFNSIKSCAKCKTSAAITKFCKIFMKRLFNHVSNNPYKLITKYGYDKEKGKIAWRPNHGSIHHLRTISLSIQIYNIFKNKRCLLFYSYFPTYQHILAAILASVFVSLLRIDEDDKIGGTEGAKLKFTNIELWKKLFPTLAKRPELINMIEALMATESGMTYSLTQLASCFMFISLIRTLLLPHPKDDEFVEILGLSNILYMSDNSKEILDLLNSRPGTFDGNNIVQKLNLIHGLTMAPHYLEHCRGGFSDGLYRVFVYKSLYNIGATHEDMLSLVYTTINNILKTGEYPSWNGIYQQALTTNSVKECLYTQEELKEELQKTFQQNSTLDKFKKCCKRFDKPRYPKNGPFIDLSNDFSDTWDVLNIGGSLDELFMPTEECL